MRVRASWGFAAASVGLSFAAACSSGTTVVEPAVQDAGLACSGGTTRCGSTCNDLHVDPANCGACGVACKAGEVCSSGRCATTCAQGQSTCGAACVNTATDNANCGACGVVCSPNTTCVSGACASSSADASTQDSSASDGSAQDASSSDASKSDASIVDASVSDASKADASKADAAVVDSGSCSPGSLQGFNATYTPALHTPGACTSQNITDFDTDCLNAKTASSAACSAWVKANANCSKCLVTPDTSPKWGPLVSVNNSYYAVNTAGCFELLGDTACAKSVQSAQTCDSYACDANCPVTDQTSYNALQACYSSVNAAGCKSYATASDACINSDSGTANTCTNAPDFDTLFLRLAPKFCQ